MRAFLYKFILAVVLTVFFVFSIPFLGMIKTGELKKEKRLVFREIDTRVAKKKKKKVKKRIIRKKRMARRSKQAMKGSGRFAMDLTVQGTQGAAALDNAASGKGSFRSWEVDTPPIPSMESPAPFPAQAEEKQLEGLVEVSFVINEKGNTEMITIEKEEPLGYGFGAAVIQTINRWRYKPATMAGVPVSIEVRRVVEFKY
jgi:TonB family protein